MVLLKRKGRELGDYLRYNPLCRRILAHMFSAKARFCKAPLTTLDLLCKSIRLTDSDSFRDRLMAEAAALSDSGTLTKYDLLNANPAFQDKVINRGIILKPRISDNEPGVIYIAFEVEWARLLNISDLEAFSKEYRLVVAPSSSPPQSVFTYLFPRFFPAPFFNLISNKDDLHFFPKISDSYHPLPLYASNWVNPDLFIPVAKDERDIDILMVAMFGKVKRHFALFKALKQMPKDIKVTLVGQDWDDRTADSVREEAVWYGVDEQVNILGRRFGEELMQIFCHAKVSVILSKREGSCVVVTESFFADTPVGLLEDAGIGSKVFINDASGCLLPENKLAEALTAFIQNHKDYSPRQSALEQGISYRESSETLNSALKSYALSNGEEWTQDIYSHFRQPGLTYSEGGNREAVQKDINMIRDRYGIEIRG